MNSKRVEVGDKVTVGFISQKNESTGIVDRIPNPALPGDYWVILNEANRPIIVKSFDYIILIEKGSGL